MVAKCSSLSDEAATLHGTVGLAGGVGEGAL
jgi:hypothetical protein